MTVSADETNPPAETVEEVEGESSGGESAADAAARAAKDGLHERPFDEIALAFSGGGYRAAAFNLGVLDMLHRLDLLRSVRMLSTVSGGTFTGLKYALSVAKGQSFEDFYKQFYGFLGRVNSIGDALAGLHERNGSPFDGQMPSLIRSSAEIYASPEMLGSHTLKDLFDDEKSHLMELSFNAVEFRSGIYFRFVRSQRAVFGNNNIRVNRGVAEMIRLADIAAASSCFPAAYEPIRFPDDFLWPKPLEEVRAQLGSDFKKCVPLMDGGIYDNQGVDSIIQRYQRGDNKIGLVIISDTNQRPYETRTEPGAPPATWRDSSIFEFKPEPRRGWLSVGLIAKAAWALFFLSVLTVIGVSVNAVETISAREGGFNWLDIFAYVVPYVFSAAVAFGLCLLRLAFKEGQRRVAELTKIELWPHLKHLTVPELYDIISGRVKSLVALTTSIFLKRVRGLVYRDISVYGKYKGRLLPNLIYDLNTPRKSNKLDGGLAPTEQMARLADAAEDVATSLWIKNPDDLKTLVACGQATICFNIMRYIKGRKNTGVAPDPMEDEILARAEPFWALLKENPKALLRQS